MLIGIIIGVIIWQAVIVIMNYANINEGLINNISCGVWILPILLLGTLYRKIRLAYYRTFYDIYFAYTPGREGAFITAVVLIKKSQANQYYQRGENSYFIEWHGSGKNIKSVTKGDFLSKEGLEKYKKPLDK